MILLFRIKIYTELSWQKHHCRIVASMCRIVWLHVQQFCGVKFLDVLIFLLIAGDTLNRWQNQTNRSFSANFNFNPFSDFLADNQ